MCIELRDRGIAFQRQVPVPAIYKGHLLGQYRVDIIVQDRVIVEVKSVSTITAVHEGQLLTYLRLTTKRLGLLINFNVKLLKDGITRMAL